MTKGLNMVSFLRSLALSAVVLIAALMPSFADCTGQPSANRICASPNGVSGVMSPRAMVDADVPSVLAGKSLTGGTHTAITSLGIRSTGAAFDLSLAVTEVLTAGRTLTFTLNNVNRTVNLGGNFTTSGANITLTATGSTNITLPTTGTLATLAGSETLTNKSIVASQLTGQVAVANGGTGVATLIAEQQRLGYPIILGGFANSVNFNSVADTSITITSPTTNWRLFSLTVINQGTTASLTTAQFGLFSGAGGTGTALQASGTALSAITSNAVNTGGGATSFGGSLAAYFNFTTVFFRITQAQGAAASGSVYIVIEPMP